MPFHCGEDVDLVGPNRRALALQKEKEGLGDNLGCPATDEEEDMTELCWLRHDASLPGRHTTRSRCRPHLHRTPL